MSKQGPERGEESQALAGVAVEPLSAEDARRLSISSGVVVSEVDPDTPAERAGLRPDDVIRGDPPQANPVGKGF